MKQRPPYQVRMPEDLYKNAMKKANGMGLSFAAYVRTLLTNDLKSSSSINPKK